MVFNRVVGATFKNFSDFGPFIAHNTVHEKQDPLFFLVPVNFLDARI